MSNIKYKTLIIFLLSASILCAVFGSVTHFLCYDYNSAIGGSGSYELAFCFPDIISILFLLLTFAPRVLLLVYIWKFHRQYKATVLYPIACGLIAVNSFLSIVCNFFAGYGFEIVELLAGAPSMISFILLTIDATKGLHQKIYTVVATSIALASCLLSLVSALGYCSYYMELGWYLYVFTAFVNIISAAALYASLLLFGLHNRIPTLVSGLPEQEKKCAKKMKPDQALRCLKDQFDLGILTEEEYQTQRAEIIRKL